MKTLIAFALTLTLAATAFAAPPKTLQIGDRAPDFKLPATDGKTYALADFEDAAVLVILFTCNHCPTAQAYEARIKKMVVDYARRPVKIIAISPNDPLAVRLDELGYSDVGDSLEDMKIRAKQAKFNFLYLYDGQTQSGTTLAQADVGREHPVGDAGIDPRSVIVDDEVEAIGLKAREQPDLVGGVGDSVEHQVLDNLADLRAVDIRRPEAILDVKPTSDRRPGKHEPGRLLE